MRTGTIFERSHIPLHKWVYAMYLLVTDSFVDAIKGKRLTYKNLIAEVA